MRVILEGEERIRLTAEGEGFGFDAAVELSPFHLLAASLATCTYSVLHGWSHHAGLTMEGLEIVVDWTIGGDPVRVTGVQMELVWPGLPEARREAAARVAGHCTVHRTLEHGSHVETRVAAGREAR